MEYDEKKLFPLDVRHLHTKETFRQKITKERVFKEKNQKMERINDKMIILSKCGMF